MKISKLNNKFVDVAVATNADFIVTNDKHFKILETIDFHEGEYHYSREIFGNIRKRSVKRINP